jgi:hypothetical protein
MCVKLPLAPHRILRVDDQRVEQRDTHPLGGRIAK